MWKPNNKFETPIKINCCFQKLFVKKTHHVLKYEENGSKSELKTKFDAYKRENKWIPSMNKYITEMTTNGDSAGTRQAYR